MSGGLDGPGTRTRLPESHSGSARRPPQPRRALVTVVGVVIVLIAAIAFANRGGSHDASPSATSSGGSRTSVGSGSGHGGSSGATAPTGVRPVTGNTDGIPSGFAHTQQGAQSAAANYAVVLGGVDMFDTDRRHRVVATLYSPAHTGQMQTALDRAYSGDMLKTLGLRPDGTAPAGLTFVSRTVPVGAKVTASTDDTATVEVWCTGLVGLAGLGSTNPVSSTWFTVTEQLRWTGGDWKIDSSAQKDGPAPVNSDGRAATADEIAGAVQQFGGFTYAR